MQCFSLMLRLASWLVLLISVVTTAGCDRPSGLDGRFFVAASSQVGHLLLVPAAGRKPVELELPGVGAISSVAVFNGQLVLGCASRGPSIDRQDPAQGLWALSLDSQQVRRYGEAEIKGSVRMCAVLGSELWIFEGERLWSTKDLQAFQLQHESVRAVIAAGVDSLLVQRKDNGLFWLRRADDATQEVDTKISLGKSAIYTMFGEYTFVEDGRVLHLVPPVELGVSNAGSGLLHPQRDPDVGFSASFDPRFKTWITMRRSMSSATEIRVNDDVGQSLQVRGHRICSVAEITRQEWELLLASTSSWQAK